MRLAWLNTHSLRWLVSTHGDKLWIADSETDGLEVYGPMSKHKAWIVGIKVRGRREMYCIDTRHTDWPEMQELLCGVRFVGHNFRFDVHAMGLAGRCQGWFDTMLLTHRVNVKTRKSLDDLFPGEKTPTLPELKCGQIGKLTKGVNDWDPRLLQYLYDDLDKTERQLDKVEPILRGRSGPDVLRQRDADVERVVAIMEDRGVKLLTDRLGALRARISPLVDAAASTIRAAGFRGGLGKTATTNEFKDWLASIPRYRRAFTYDKWNKTQRQMVRGFYTDSGTTLARWLNNNPDDQLIQALVDYRGWRKKRDYFCDTLPDFIQADGLIHGQITTAHTSTGRYSHRNPNLGQIPKRDQGHWEFEVGKAFRACFRGPTCGGASGADFEQVELKTAAALSGDERMLDAYARGIDLHAATAASTAGCAVENLPAGERFKAKMTNFGILNGMTAKRLAVNIKSTVAEAEAFLDKHRAAHPELHEWMAAVTDEAQTQGILTNLDGLTRTFELGQRTLSAVTQEVQGTAAVLMKEAHIALEDADMRPCISVHDEKICDLLGKGEEVAAIMQEAANNTFPEALGAVDFTCEGGSGDSWAAI